MLAWELVLCGGSLSESSERCHGYGEFLQQMGFAVTLLRDADLWRLRAAIEIFRKELRPGVVGLFYFAGHGLQVKGENYLVPIGARIAREVP